eukprot:6476312-Amphidinium_carterae.1
MSICRAAKKGSAAREMFNRFTDLGPEEESNPLGCCTISYIILPLGVWGPIEQIEHTEHTRFPRA